MRITSGSPIGQRCDAFFFEKTNILYEEPCHCLPSSASSAELQRDQKCKNTAFPKTPKQWHASDGEPRKCVTALPSRLCPTKGSDPLFIVLGIRIGPCG